jgi:two-component system LytT family response regulator
MGRPISCIIVEDEPLARERTMNYVSRLPYLQLLTTFDNGLDALVYLKTDTVDLIFLDINMGEFSGIRLLEAGALSSQVIIITAYDEYALKGFELNVTDYLLKPYTFERFLQAVEKVRNNLSRQAAPPGEKKFIFIRTEHRLEKLMLNDVFYIEGMRDYRKICTTDKHVMTLQTFGDLEQEIPAGLICRVHKSFMVALDKIQSVERDQIRIRDRMIPISETYKKAFYERINHPAANSRK